MRDTFFFITLLHLFKIDQATCSTKYCVIKPSIEMAQGPLESPNIVCIKKIGSTYIYVKLFLTCPYLINIKSILHPEYHKTKIEVEGGYL